jgi:hypothetical protein
MATALANPIKSNALEEWETGFLGSAGLTGHTFGIERV